MSKFILNDDGKLKEVASMEKPIFKHYAGFRYPEDVYTDHLAEYEQHIASLRTLTASPELLATMKVGDVVDEGDLETMRNCFVTNDSQQCCGKPKQYCTDLIAYPLPQTEDDVKETELGQGNRLNDNNGDKSISTWYKRQLATEYGFHECSLNHESALALITKVFRLTKEYYTTQTDKK